MVLVYLTESDTFFFQLSPEQKIYSRLVLYKCSPKILSRMVLVSQQISQFAHFHQKSAHLLSDQPCDFSLKGKSLSFNILFRVDQLAVTLYIEDTATAFDQFNIRIRIICLQFCFHTGSLRMKISNNSILNKNVHNVSLVLNGYQCPPNSPNNRLVRFI